MAPANPVPFESTPNSASIPSAGIQAGDAPPALVSSDAPQPVSQEELNSWRRGFTPQAEIWNGRLAMVGLSVGLTVLLLARLAATHSS
jgi:hypothetical protein